MHHGRLHCALDRVIFCHPVPRLHGALRREKSCWKPEDCLQNRALFRMNKCGRIPPIIYFSSTPESLQETGSSLTRTPLHEYTQGGRTHSTIKNQTIFALMVPIRMHSFPVSPSIPTQNGMYWHQVNSLPTTEPQRCTSPVCSKALGLYLTFMLDCMEPAYPRGEVEVEVKAAAVIRGMLHDSQRHFLAKLTWAMATQSSCCQRRPWVRPSLWPQI